MRRSGSEPERTITDEGGKTVGDASSRIWYEKKDRTSMRIKLFNQRYYILMLALPVIWYILFIYVPMGGIVIAFKDYKLAKGVFGSNWVGFKYFIQIFTDYYARRVIYNTIGISFMKLLFGFPAPILFALLLNEVAVSSYKRVVQTVSYLPYFISWVVVMGICKEMLSSDGILNTILLKIGILNQPVSFMVDRNAIWPIAVISDIWKNLGWNSIIYLAAIAGINMELYEAAEIDGARRLGKAWHVTLPGIRPTIVLILIFTMGSLFQGNFDQMYMLSTSSNMSGGTGITASPVQDVAEILDTYIYRQGLQRLQFSYGTAVTLVRSVLILMMVLLTNKVVKLTGEEGIW